MNIQEEIKEQRRKTVEELKRLSERILKTAKEIEETPAYDQFSLQQLQLDANMIDLQIINLKRIIKYK